jgi:hypothetical protein
MKTLTILLLLIALSCNAQCGYDENGLKIDKEIILTGDENAYLMVMKPDKLIICARTEFYHSTSIDDKMFVFFLDQTFMVLSNKYEINEDGFYVFYPNQDELNKLKSKRIGAIHIADLQFMINSINADILISSFNCF